MNIPEKNTPLIPIGHQNIPLSPCSINLLACRWATLEKWGADNFSAPYWRIYWNSSKGWSVWLDDVCIPLDPKWLFIIPANTPYKGISQKKGTQFFIRFVIESLLHPFKTGVYRIPLSKKIKSLISELKEVDISKPEQAFFHAMQVKYLCYHCLVHLPKASLQVIQYSPKTKTAMSTMIQNLSHPFSNKELAKTIGMNTNAFIRLFHQETGQSPQKWYVEKRINQASLLLSHSNNSIDSIAAQTGFCDRAHFSRVFSAIKKMGPGAYRKRMKKMQ